MYVSELLVYLETIYFYFVQKLEVDERGRSAVYRVFFHIEILAGEGHRAAWHVRVLGDILGLVSMYIT